MNLKGCTGCRSCELACSFHKVKSFDPAQSSIQVYRDNSSGLTSVVLDDHCDLCADEEKPLCICFCAPDALNLSLLNKLKRNAGQSSL
jgi:Fe-S-cluster-containing hydrogenase component 2